MSVYRERLKKLREAMEEHDADLAVLTPSPYMFWATGVRDQPWFGSLRGPGDWMTGVFISQTQVVLAVHWMVHRILIRDPKALQDVFTEVVVVNNEDDPDRVLQSILAKFPATHGVALADRTWFVFGEALRAALPYAVISPASELMDSLVAIKDASALEKMRRAAAMNAAAYGEVLKFLKAGVTVEDIALEVDYQFRRAGAEGNAFRSTVVIGGPEPLRDGAPKRLRPGDSVMFDIGCAAEGYCCDFGRSAYFGDPPPEYLRLHETNLRAQRVGMDALRAGKITCGEIVPLVQDVMREYPGVSNLIPQVGHAIGMTVHEPPFFIVGDKTVVQAGMTFTIEPTLRIPDRFCNRVEDIILVTDGAAEYITHYPRELYVIQ
jgi:Xaa-Pro dipeptidase